MHSKRCAPVVVIAIVLTLTQVLNEPIKLLHVDSDVVVVDKPSSIPVHPVGRFKVSKSLVVELMALEVIFVTKLLIALHLGKVSRSTFARIAT